MDFKQIASITNTIVGEEIKGAALVQEDLTGIIDVGKSIANLPSNARENVFGKLLDRIAETIFRSEKFQLEVPEVYKGSNEWGSIIQKIRVKMPSAVETQSWDLQAGTSYEDNTYNPLDIEVTYFNQIEGFKVEFSKTETYLKECFDGPAQVNALFGAFEQAVRNAIVVRLNALTKRLISNGVALAVKHDMPNGIGTATGNMAIDLCRLYNTEHGLTGSNRKSPADFIKTPELMRYANRKMMDYLDFIKAPSTMYNIAGVETTTPDSEKIFILNSQWAHMVESEMYSSTFHDNYVKLSGYTTLPNWQGNNGDNSFDSCTTVKIKDSEGTAFDTTNKANVIGVLADKRGLMIYSERERANSNYVRSGEFYNFRYMSDLHLYEDKGENFIVFMLCELEQEQ